MTAAFRYLPPAALTVWLFVVALAGVSAHYEPAHAAVLLALYPFLAAVLHGLTLVGVRWAWSLSDRPWLTRSIRWTAGIPAGLTAVLQLREQTFVPHSWTLVLVFGLLVGALYGEAVARLEPRVRSGVARAVGVTLAAGLALCAVLGACLDSEALRWHLLRHNTLLGTPVFYLTQPSTSELQAKLFRQHGAALLEDPAAAAAPHSSHHGTFSPPPPSPPAATAPHIVFVLLDTLRADALAPWRGEDPEPPPMPGLDAFLASGYALTDVWANSSWTRPSMVSMFTGLLPEEHGARDIGHVVSEHLDTLPERLRDCGYSTVGFMTNVAALGSVTGFSQGFDLYHEFGQAPYARAGFVRRTVEAWLEQPETQETIAGGPLFLHLHFLDPHEPYLAGDEPWRKDPDAYRLAYRNELEYLDGELTDLLETVDAALSDRPTVYVVLSDHGEEFGEHELYGHGQSLYDELIHVPAAVVTRRMAAAGSGKITARLEGRDFFFLLRRFAQGEAVSVPQWATENAREHRYASVYYTREGALALRPYLRQVVMRATDDGRHKLIWSAYGDTRELYSPAEDPLESSNLLDREEKKAEVLTTALDDPIRRWTLPQTYEASEDNLEQLRALGYID